MSFKIGSFKNFAIFTGKHLCRGLFLIKLQAFKPENFLKINSNTGVSCGYREIFKNIFFYRTPPVAASDGLTTVQQNQMVCLSFDFAPSRAFDFDKKFTQNVAQIIVYYHVTKQFFPCLKWLITCFRFQNMFWKKVSCFRFWWKTYTKRCTNNYVISRVKRLFSPRLCGWSSASDFGIWFGKWKNAV